jgi:hypothetical protein
LCLDKPQVQSRLMKQMWFVVIDCVGTVVNDRSLLTKTKLQLGVVLKRLAQTKMNL